MGRAAAESGRDPLVHRRTVLLALAGGLVMAGSMAPQTGLLRSPALRRIAGRIPGVRGYVSLADGSMEEWVGRTGTVFTTDTGYRLRLAGIVPLPSFGDRPAHLRPRAFLAAFDLAAGVSMPGSIIHRLSHRGGPSFDLYFDAPSARSEGRMYAVFN